MVNFLLLNEQITPYNKKIIDKGFTPKKIYKLCSCIRETFCLSYSIRKDNNLFLYFQKEQILVSFIGIELRYLGPDERSQALLLEKALNNAKQIIINRNDGRKQSTPGIYVSRFLDHASFLRYLLSLIQGIHYILIENETRNKIERDIYDPNINFEFFYAGSLFIIPIYDSFIRNFKILDLLKEMKNIKYFSLSKIKLIENKILYINFRKDHQDIVQL